jgi:hypothetical protein
MGRSFYTLLLTALMLPGLALFQCSNSDDGADQEALLLLILEQSSSSTSVCGGTNENWDGTSEDLSLSAKNHAFKKFTPAADGTFTVTLTWTGGADVDQLRLYVGGENTIMSTDPHNLGDYTLSDTSEITPATITTSVTSGSFRCIAIYAPQCDSSSDTGSGTCDYSIQVN